MSDNLLQKVITSQGVSIQSGGGALNREQSDRFIDYLWDATVLLPQVRTRRMRSDVEDIDKIGVGRRILRGATEAVDDGLTLGVRFTKISLTSTKLRADWELTRDLLEDNIEGEELEDHIARMITRQVGQDLEELAINGNKDSADPLFHHLDGFGVRGRTDGNVVDAAGETITRPLLSRMLKAMPRQFIGRRGALKFFAGSDLVQDYADHIGAIAEERQEETVRDSTSRTDNPLGGQAGYSMMGNGGVRLQEVPLMEGYDVAATDPDGVADSGDETEAYTAGEIWLTNPQNLVWGIRREVEVFTEFKPKKDAIEYTIFTRVAANVEEKSAFVVARNVRVVE